MKPSVRNVCDALGLILAALVVVRIAALPEPRFDSRQKRLADPELSIQLRREDWCTQERERQGCVVTMLSVFDRYNVPSAVQQATLERYGSKREPADPGLPLSIGSTVKLVIPSGTE